MLGAILAGSNLDGSGSPVPNVPCRMLLELMRDLTPYYNRIAAYGRKCMSAKLSLLYNLLLWGSEE